MAEPLSANFISSSPSNLSAGLAPLSPLDTIIYEKVDPNDKNQWGGQCACGNTFMPDATFCRKCGSSRGNKELDDSLVVNRWDLFMESNKEIAGADRGEEPRTLEIAYSVVKGEVLHEIVFEDPTEVEKRPRLLVSLQSVLALKALCEREFDRVEVISHILKHCRTAYYKELQYLREQLKRATSPNYVPDSLENYEVYWYDPPEYIDSDMKSFLQDCIRLTNKKLIEENFELIQKLKALGAGEMGGDDSDIIRMIRTLGPGGFPRKIWAFLQMTEHGSPEKRKDFEIAVREILRKTEGDGGDSDGESNKDAQIRKLQAQIDKLLKQAADGDALKKQSAQCEEFKTLAAEADARAREEKARADQLEAMKQALEDELAELRAQMKDFNPAKLKEGIATLTQKIDSIVYQIDPNAAPGTASSDGPLSPLEISVSALQGCMNGPGGALSRMKGGGGDTASLQAQLKAFQDRENKMKDDILRLQQESQRLKKERDAEAAAAAAANARMGGGDLGKLQQELRNLKEANERMARELEEYRSESKLMREKLDQAEAENSRLKELVEGSGDLERLEALEAAAEQSAARLAQAQQKIQELKAEIRRLKKMNGMECDDSDNDSNYDGDLPLFLMSYVKRTQMQRQNSNKPRWQHLSEDARFSRQKRQFLFAQAHSSENRRTMDQDLGPKAAAEALKFLKFQEDQSEKQVTLPASAQSQRRATRHRSHSFMMREVENEPVDTALRARETVEAEMSRVLRRDHVEDVALRTGHPLHRFGNITSGQGDPALEAALAFKGAQEASKNGETVQHRKRAVQSPNQTDRANSGGSMSPSPKAHPLVSLLSAAQNVPAAMVVTSNSDEPLSPFLERASQVGSPGPDIRGRPGSRGSRPNSRGDQPDLLPHIIMYSRPQTGQTAASGVQAGAATQLTSMLSGHTSASGPGRQLAFAQPMDDAGASTRGAAAVSHITGNTSSAAPGVRPLIGRRELVGGETTNSKPAVLIKSSTEPASTAASASSAHTVGTLRALEAVANTRQQGQAVAYDAMGQTPTDCTDMAMEQQIHGNAPLQIRGIAPVQPAQALRPGTAESQSSLHMQDVEAPNSKPEVHRIRTGGLAKMETPTEWSVESRAKSPAPVTVDESFQFRPPSQGRSRPPSQGSPSQGRSRAPSQASPSTSPATRALLKEVDPARGRTSSASPLPAATASPKDSKGGLRIAECVAHFPRDVCTASNEAMPRAAVLSFVSSAGAPQVLGKRVLGDPLPTEASTSSADSGSFLPAQDSITSTVGSIISPPRGAGGKQGYSRTSDARGRAGFGNGPPPTAPAKSTSTDFNPSLGFGDRPNMARSDGFQAARSSSGALPTAEDHQRSPPKRTATAGGQRDITWGSRSTGSLPLTNTAGRNTNALSSSPTKQRRRLASSDDKAAKAEVATANREGHLPELLPAFKPGRIQKGPRVPTWLVAI